MSKTNDVIEIYKLLTDENKRKFMALLNLAVREETLRTAQAASSFPQKENR